YEKALAAKKNGAFDAELVRVEVPGRKGAVTVVDKDETPRETTLEGLAKLKPAFKEGGTITAGNASKLNDGGAAVVVASADRARELRVTPMARVIAQGQYAHEPELFLSAPRGAIARCLEKAGWSVGDVDLFEVNEAFSGIECVRRELDIPEAKFNVNGGAVALGHPIGAPAREIASRIRTATDVSVLKDAELVVEAAFEDPKVKGQLFADLDRVTAKDVILTSNTSSIPIDGLASRTGRPDRVAGMHFM